MFRRIPWDELLTDIRAAGILLLLIGAIILLVRLHRMRGEEADKLSRLPLDDE